MWCFLYNSRAGSAEARASTSAQEGLVQARSKDTDNLPAAWDCNQDLKEVLNPTTLCKLFDFSVLPPPYIPLQSTHEASQRDLNSVHSMTLLQATVASQGKNETKRKKKKKNKNKEEEGKTKHTGMRPTPPTSLWLHVLPHMQQHVNLNLHAYRLTSKAT